VFANSVQIIILIGMNRGDLTNTQWERLQPLLPPQTPKTGRPAVDHHCILNGILWILRTGAPWRDLPERDGPWRTVASRFYRWQHAGIWARLFSAVQAQADANGQLTWDVPYVDGTMIRAHQHAAGAKKKIPPPKREGAARVGSAPKCTCVQQETVSCSPSG
jgi:transposase